MFKFQSPSKPQFSVVVATFGRDSQIIPTLLSIAEQDLQDYEVIVVSDGPASNPLEETVREFGPKFSLYNLPQRTRSQSGPNNLGWLKARGEHVAYLGHDDIWARNHLSCLAEAFESQDAPDFAVSGCLYFGPLGTGDDLTWVTGVFDNRDEYAPFTNFFPPSSFAHKRKLRKIVPRWTDPLLTRRPVDTEFILGAADRGCSFASTGVITVLKFASALRYLSYLCPDDYEQSEMLKLTREPKKLKLFIENRVEAARRKGGYMASKHAREEQFRPGQKMLENEFVRGISLPKVRPLTDEVIIGPGAEFRGFDWHSLEQVEGKEFRWTGPSPRPRFLVPFTSSGLVKIEIKIKAFASHGILDSLKILLNGSQINFTSEVANSHFLLSFTSYLHQSQISVLEFQMTELQLAFTSNSLSESLDTKRDESESLWNSSFSSRGFCLESLTLKPQL